MEPKKCKSIWHLIGKLITAATEAMVKGMAKKEDERGAVYAEALLPYLNAHNIGLILTEKNISGIKNAIINNALPALDKHYMLQLEPTINSNNICFRIYSYPKPALPDAKPNLENTIWLSQMSQPQLLTFISKFLPDGNKSGK